MIKIEDKDDDIAFEYLNITTLDVKLMCLSI